MLCLEDAEPFPLGDSMDTTVYFVLGATALRYENGFSLPPGTLPCHCLLLSLSFRLPSGWLSLDKSVFQLVAQTVGASMWREAGPETEPPRTEPLEVLPTERPARGLSPHPPW